MHFSPLLFATLASLVNAAHLSLNGGSVKKLTCGLDCLTGLDCSQSAVDTFQVCVASQCDSGDVSVAPAVERLMASCHSFVDTNVETEALDELKSLYLSSQMAIFKRQTASNGTSSSNSSGNSSSNSTSGSTGTDSSASGTQTGTYATSCSSVADVLDGTCIVRSTGAAAKVTRNSVLAFVGAAVLAAFAL